MQEVDQDAEDLVIQRKYSSSEPITIPLPHNPRKQDIEELILRVDQNNQDLPILSSIETQLRPQGLTFLLFAHKTDKQYPFAMNSFLNFQERVRGKGNLYVVEDQKLAEKLGFQNVETGMIGVLVPEKHKHLRRGVTGADLGK